MRARTVNINGNNSADLNITLINVFVSGAEAKLLEVEVPYANGTLDMTDIFGSVKYSNREIEMDFHIPYGVDHWGTYSNVSNLLNGQTVSITFSADPNYYWEGRANVGQLNNDDGHWAFTITATVNPYKRKITDTVVEGTAGTDGVDVECVNGRMSVVPEFLLDDNTVVTWNNKTYTAVNGGTFTWADIIFSQGTNTINIKGTNGDVAYKITYKEGSL